MSTKYAYYESPIGLTEIGAAADGICALNFVEEPAHPPADHPLLVAAQDQLGQYFAGARQQFDLPLALSGSDFQRRVWQQLLQVAHGHTSSYQAIADAIGNPKSVRAVGAANGQNPVSIVVPCHRIIGSNGQLTGYGGGLWRKEWLLRHEGALLI